MANHYYAFKNDAFVFGVFGILQRTWRIAM
jgi:hypothetical protein